MTARSAAAEARTDKVYAISLNPLAAPDIAGLGVVDALPGAKAVGHSPVVFCTTHTPLLSMPADAPLLDVHVTDPPQSAGGHRQASSAAPAARFRRHSPAAADRRARCAE